jgi:predicted transposase YdaD
MSLTTPCWQAIYSNAFPLVDVTVIPDDDIAGHQYGRPDFTAEHIHQRDLAER